MITIKKTNPQTNLVYTALVSAYVGLIVLYLLTVLTPPPSPAGDSEVRGGAELKQTAKESNKGAPRSN